MEGQGNGEGCRGIGVKGWSMHIHVHAHTHLPIYVHRPLRSSGGLDLLSLFIHLSDCLYVFIRSERSTCKQLNINLTPVRNIFSGKDGGKEGRDGTGKTTELEGE